MSAKKKSKSVLFNLNSSILPLNKGERERESETSRIQNIISCAEKLKVKK